MHTGCPVGRPGPVHRASRSCSRAKISAVNLLARQFPWTTRERKAALLEAINAVGDLHCLNYILLDQHHTGTFSLDLRKCYVNIGDNDRRQPETDLVAEKDAGIGHQRPSNRSHLLL